MSEKIFFFRRKINLLTLLSIDSCGFVNEEFLTEIQKFAKEQQVLVKQIIAIFNTRLKFVF